jgi:hypothetical protein
MVSGLPAVRESGARFEDAPRKRNILRRSMLNTFHEEVHALRRQPIDLDYRRIADYLQNACVSPSQATSTLTEERMQENGRKLASKVSSRVEELLGIVYRCQRG